MSIIHKWRGLFCSARKGEQCSGTGNNGRKQFHHFRLTTESVVWHFIPDISIVLIMSVLLVSTTAYADSRAYGKNHHHYRSGPVNCEELATDPANGLADNPVVKSATSQINSEKFWRGVITSSIIRLVSMGGMSWARVRANMRPAKPAAWHL
jgi:hypothetical protein